MSELAVGSLKGLAANSFVIDVASGSKIVQPGAILQVISVTKTDVFSTSSTTFQDITDMSVSITPSSATNKVMVFATFSASAGPGQGAAFVRVIRNGSAVNVGDASGSRIQVGAGTFGKDDEGETGLLSTLGQSITFLDAPATTSAVVYKLQLRERDGSVSAAVGRSGADGDSSTFSRAPTNLTVMEVAG
jgi:hypothetical protein